MELLSQWSFGSSAWWLEILGFPFESFELDYHYHQEVSHNSKQPGQKPLTIGSSLWDHRYPPRIVFIIALPHSPVPSPGYCHACDVWAAGITMRGSLGYDYRGASKLSIFHFKNGLGAEKWEPLLWHIPGRVGSQWESSSTWTMIFVYELLLLNVIGPGNALPVERSIAPGPLILVTLLSMGLACVTRELRMFNGSATQPILILLVEICIIYIYVYIGIGALSDVVIDT